MKERLISLFNNMRTDELICIHNEYCDVNGCCYGKIYSMDDFDELMTDVEPWEVARNVFFGDFNPTHDYFKFNGYGNLESVRESEIEENCFVDDIIDYIIDNNYSLHNDEVQEILDEFEAIEERAEAEEE